MMNYQLTVQSIFERARTNYAKSKIVTRLPDKSIHTYTYIDFYHRAKQLASALTKAGVKKGDKVATLMWNHYGHLEAYYGIALCGAIVHTVNLRLFHTDIAYIINHAEDKVLIIDSVLLPLYNAFKSEISVKKIIVFNFNMPHHDASLIDYEEFIKTGDSNYTPPTAKEEDEMGMCYTSGTTGHPKGVMFTHRATILHALITTLPDALNLSSHSAVLPVVPMFHVMAWGLPFSTIMNGCKIVFPGPNLDAVSLLDLFEREKVDRTAGVPTIWLGVLQELMKKERKWNLPAMEMIIGGSAVPESMVREYDKFGIKIIHAWGMTEMSPVGTVSRSNPYVDANNTEAQYSYRVKQGVTVPLVEARITDENGEASWDGKSMGELEVKGPCIASEYYKLPNEKNKWTTDGWFKTGDIAVIDADGYVKLVDRTKDLVKSGGEWISSVDLENALVGHPAVREAAVISIPHHKWDERPFGIIVLKENQTVSGDELKEFLKKNFAHFWIPDEFDFIKEIPHTATGKISKLKLREMYRDKKW